MKGTKTKRKKRGEGYLDVCVAVVVFVMLLVLAINLFSFVTLRVEMDQIAEGLLECATYTGCFGTLFDDRCNELEKEYYDFDVDYGADEYFNSTYERVQLGEKMWVTVTVKTSVRGVGIELPVTLSVTKSGLSEKYWK